jgi:hypothetical protein
MVHLNNYGHLGKTFPLPFRVGYLYPEDGRKNFIRNFYINPPHENASHPRRQ